MNESNKIIQLRCTFGDDTLDTFNDTFTLVHYGTDVFKFEFHFTLAEQQKIISEINKVKFFDLPDELPNRNEEDSSDSNKLEIAFRISGDWGDQYCDVLLDGRKKTIFWVDYASYKDSEDYKNLNSVIEIIREIVWSRKEIKIIPKELWY